MFRSFQMSTPIPQTYFLAKYTTNGRDDTNSAPIEKSAGFAFQAATATTTQPIATDKTCQIISLIPKDLLYNSLLNIPIQNAITAAIEAQNIEPNVLGSPLITSLTRTGSATKE